MVVCGATDGLSYYLQHLVMLPAKPFQLFCDTCSRYDLEFLFPGTRDMFVCQPPQTSEVGWTGQNIVNRLNEELDAKGFSLQQL